MPSGNRRHDPSPEELARQIAEQLARSGPTAPRSSLRDSVLVGRVVAGLAALASISLVVAGVIAGAGWLLAQTADPQPEVLADTMTVDDADEAVVAGDTTTMRLDGTLLPLVPLMFPTPLSDTAGSVGEPGPTTIPSTTSTMASTTTSTVSGTGSSTPSTAATTTQPSTTTTLTATTTTTVPPTTTTTESTTTTLATSTTTTEVTTTTRPYPPSTPGQGG